MTQSSSLSRPLVWLMILLGALVALAGLGLAGGGVMLIARGGSWYYLLMALPCSSRASRSRVALLGAR